ncbi:MAG: PEP-CTERM sorting domain-containing protein, partial [Alphaproteobacteria bacterium]|nr:PEP-CTERM sorting domain-containing protein [Alphaproteobacteria bacterium]
PSILRTITYCCALMLAMLGFASTSLAAIVLESEPNDFTPIAQNIDAFFDLAYDVNIENTALVNTSTSIPHAEIHGTGDGTLDYYSFYVGTPLSKGIFDIDCGYGGCSTGDFNSRLSLFTLPPGGALWANVATYAPTIDTGSFDLGGYTIDGFIQYTFTTPGYYVLEVKEDGSSYVPAGADYVLNVSIENHAVSGSGEVPEPATLSLFGLGLLGLGAARRRNRKA